MPSWSRASSNSPGRPSASSRSIAWASYADEAREVGIPSDERTYSLDVFIGDLTVIGRGVGSRVVTLLSNYLIDTLGASAVSLMTDVNNLAAQRCYENAGFHKVGQVVDTETYMGERALSWLVVKAGPAHKEITVNTGELGEASDKPSSRRHGAREDALERTNIELVLGWLHALRRGNHDEARWGLAGVWKGLRAGTGCSGPRAVVEGFIAGRDEGLEADSLELVGGHRHVVLGVRMEEPREAARIRIEGEFYNVFTLEEGRITRIDDYRDRGAALAAAGSPTGHEATHG